MDCSFQYIIFPIAASGQIISRCVNKMNEHGGEGGGGLCRKNTLHLETYSTIKTQQLLFLKPNS
jgi:hypothetical protein